MPLIASVFLSAGCGIAYEILAATTLTDLYGASVYHFSLVIGVYLAALGVGGWLSSKISERLLDRLVKIELGLAALGGSLAFLIMASEVWFSETFGTPARWMFPSWALVLVFLTGTLVGLELPLFSRALAGLEDLKGALGKAFFWDYAGGLVISVSLPIVFLPTLGLLRTCFLMGLLNGVAALILLAATGARLRSRLLTGVCLAGVLAINIAGLRTAPTLEWWLESQRYFAGEEVQLIRRSPYQKIVLTHMPNDDTIALYLNNQRQFQSGPSEVLYHEMLVHPVMSLAASRQHVLILGGGDGLALREVLKYPDVEDVTLVDIDHQVVDLAKTRPDLRELSHLSFFDPRVHFVTDDALMYVRRRPAGTTYGVIIVDFPDPTEDSLARLYSKEFYRELLRVAGREGIVAVQSGHFLSFYHRTAFTTMRAAGFASVMAYAPKVRWAFHAMTLASARQNLHEAFQQFHVPIHTSMIHSREDLGQLMAYGAIQPYFWFGLKPNTLSQPVILHDPSYAIMWKFRFKRVLDRLKGALSRHTLEPDGASAPRTAT